MLFREKPSGVKTSINWGNSFKILANNVRLMLTDGKYYLYTTPASMRATLTRGKQNGIRAIIITFILENKGQSKRLVKVRFTISDSETNHKKAFHFFEENVKLKWAKL